MGLVEEVMSTYIVAELGACHDGSWDRLERMVTACVEAGASACKLQYWSDSERLADRRHATPAYRDIYRRYQIPQSWLPAFAALCHEHGIEAVCTVYLPEDVAFVAKYADRTKVASFENEDFGFIDTCLATQKPVMVSCGMAADVHRKFYLAAPRWMRTVYWLHCVSAYPAEVDGALWPLVLDESGNEYDGYSDHTHNVWTGAVAVACGAKIIEVHVRAYDTDPANPDYATALDPAEFRTYVDGIRTAERLIADVPVDESAMQRFKVRAE